MLEYFQTYYLLHEMGPGYIVTNIFYAVATVLLLRQPEKMRSPRGILETLGHMVGCWVFSVAFCGVGYGIFGQNMFVDRVMMLAMLGIYALCFSKLKATTRLMRSMVFFSCMLHIIPISEPLGKIFEAINESYTWAEHFTWVVVILLGAGVLFLLLRYSTEDAVFVPRFPCIIMGAEAAIGACWQMISVTMEPARSYNVLAAASFLTITLLGYCMFYGLSEEYNQNLELLALRHKQTLDEELLEFSKENYAEIHELRHELQNHMSYIQTLLEAGNYEKLKEYAASVCGEAESIFQFVECGNQVVNTVLNHIIRQGEAAGVKFQYQVVLPPQVPFKDTEFCSLLSNILENALEAAKASGREDPVVSVRILPQQDYLFIHVENPVNDTVPKQQRLSLVTTKEDRRTHGYGTRIIRNLVKKYQGSVKFNMHDGIFTTDVMLCLKQEENHD